MDDFDAKELTHDMYTIKMPNAIAKVCGQSSDAALNVLSDEPAWTRESVIIGKVSIRLARLTTSSASINKPASIQKAMLTNPYLVNVETVLNWSDNCAYGGRKETRYP
jgi:hypothetical protein